MPRRVRSIAPYASAKVKRVAATAVAPTYLSRFTFSNDAGGPLTSPYVEILGALTSTLTLIQTDGNFSISGGNLVMPAQATPNFGDEVAYEAAGWSRAIGRVFALKFKRTGGTSTKDMLFGWWSNTTFSNSNNQRAGINISGTGLLMQIPGLALTTIADNTDYVVLLVCRSIGMHILIQGGAFGTLGSSDYTRLWADATNNALTLIPALVNYWAAALIDTWTVTDLPAPWNAVDDYADKTDRVAVPTTGATLTTVADGFVEFTWTVVAAETVDILFRRVDDNNCWIARCDQAASKLFIYEKVAGVETERGTAGGAAMTWTATAVYRIIPRFIGAAIDIFAGTGAAPLLKNSYASAATNLTATTAKVTGFTTGANFVSWSRSASVTIPF